MRFDLSRYELWVTVSFRWLKEKKDEIIPSRIQGLGLLDAYLYGVNKYDIEDKKGRIVVNEYNIPNFDYININSYLWVLGVYELFRMIDQRMKENSNPTSINSVQAINETKKIFQRLRVPLAKLESANKFKNIDYEVPLIGANNDQLGWKINDNEIIYYRNLSDLTISTLRKINKK